MKKLLTIMLSVFGLVLFGAGCNPEPETPGEKIEEMGEEMGDAVDDAADNVEDAAEEAADAVEDATDQ